MLERQAAHFVKNQEETNRVGGGGNRQAKREGMIGYRFTADGQDRIPLLIVIKKVKMTIGPSPCYLLSIRISIM